MPPRAVMDSPNAPGGASRAHRRAPRDGEHERLPRSEQTRSDRGHRGAAALGRTHYDVYGYIKDRADRVNDAIGGLSWNTYDKHITSPGANEHSTVDHWGPGGRGDPIGKRKGEKTARYIASNMRKGLLDVIFNRRISTGGGFRPFSGPPHPDHVHTAWSADRDAPMAKGSGPGGGPSGVLDALGNRYNSLADFMGKTFKPPSVPALGGLGEVGGDISRGLRSTVLENAREWLTEQARRGLDFMTSRIGGEDVSANASQKEFADNMARKARDRGLPGILPVMTAWVESRLKNISGGDRDSIGLFQQRPSQGWGSPSQLRDPNYAINAFLDRAEPLAGQYGGRQASRNKLGRWAQAVQRSAYPDRYANEGYPAAQDILGKSGTKKDDEKGNPKGGITDSYRGGMADGGLALRESFTRIAEGNRPEAVLPLDNPRAQRPIQQFLGMGELRDEVADLRGDMQEWRGEQVREGRANSTRTGEYVQEGTQRNLKRGSKTIKATAKGQAKAARRSRLSGPNLRGGR